MAAFRGASEPGKPVVDLGDVLDGGCDLRRAPGFLGRADAARKHDPPPLAGHGDIRGVHVAGQRQRIGDRRFESGRMGPVEMLGHLALERTFLEDHDALLRLELRGENAKRADMFTARSIDGFGWGKQASKRLRPKSVHIALGSPSQPRPGAFAVAQKECGHAIFVPAKERIFDAELVMPQPTGAAICL